LNKGHGLFGQICEVVIIWDIFFKVFSQFPTSMSTSQIQGEPGQEESEFQSENSWEEAFIFIDRKWVRVCRGHVDVIFDMLENDRDIREWMDC
jgi:hypothetical protein